MHGLMPTNLSCTANSSLVSSSSQLSSQRCVLPPGICVSSSVQSATRQQTVPRVFASSRCAFSGFRVPSAGKSSNSSSSSSCAAGFFSAAGSPFFDLSSVAALVVAAEPWAAPDIVTVFRGVRRRGCAWGWVSFVLLRCGSDGSGDQRGVD
jgi:hypothetical protein